MRNVSEFLMRKDNWISSGFYTLCLTLFLMPFPRSWSLYPLGVFLFFGLLSWILSYGRLKDEFTKKWPIVLAPVCYFILHLIYIIPDPKLVYLEKKLMFILIPVLGFPVFISDYLSKNITVILKSFIYGILLICIFQFCRATIESITFADGVIKFNPVINEELSRFTWDQLSTFEHPTYLTLKVLWSLCLLVSLGNFLKISRYLKVLVILLFTVFVFSLSSRAGIFILALLLIYFIYNYLVKKNKRILLLIIIPFIIFSTYGVLRINKRMTHKLEETIERSAIEKAGVKGLDPRTKSWFSALNLIKKRPVFGVGLDARDILAAEYASQGYKTEAELRLNAHNQFLETQLTFGIAGTLILFWMLGVMVIKRKESWGTDLIDSFLIIVITSMVFESILVRQWGIMFFLLFYCLLTLVKAEPALRAGSPEGK
jgi:O-antigen ligase